MDLHAAKAIGWADVGMQPPKDTGWQCKWKQVSPIRCLADFIVQLWCPTHLLLELSQQKLSAAADAQLERFLHCLLMLGRIYAARFIRGHAWPLIMPCECWLLSVGCCWCLSSILWVWLLKLLGWLYTGISCVPPVLEQHAMGMAAVNVGLAVHWVCCVPLASGQVMELACAWLSAHAVSCCMI